MLSIRGIYQISRKRDVFVVFDNELDSFEEIIEAGKLVAAFDELGISAKHDLLTVRHSCLNYSEMPPHKVLYERGKYTEEIEEREEGYKNYQKSLVSQD